MNSEEGGNNVIKVLIIVITIAIIAAGVFLVLYLQNNNNQNNNPIIPSSYNVLSYPEGMSPVSAAQILKEAPPLEKALTFKLSNRGSANYDLEFSGMQAPDTTVVESKTNNLVTKAIVKGESFELSFEIASEAPAQSLTKDPIIIPSSAFGSVVRVKVNDSTYVYSNDNNLMLGLSCAASGKTIQAPCGVPLVKNVDSYLRITCTGSGAFLVNCDSVLRFIAMKTTIL